MVFLPGTFFAVLFAIPTLDWNSQGVIQDKHWVYWAFTVPSTLLVGFAWYLITHAKLVMRTVFDARSNAKRTEADDDDGADGRDGGLDTPTADLENGGYRR
jgi:hypothetical protein